MNEQTHLLKVFLMVKKLLSTIITILLILVALIIVTQRVTNDEKSFFGMRMFIVATGSMVPVYSVGDVILVRDTDINDIKIDDDVVYIGEKGDTAGKTVTHRVINIEEIDGEKFFHTKGIANNAEDPIVSSSQIKGTVLKRLPIITFICSLMANTYTLYFIIVLPMTFYIFFKIIHVNLRKVRKNRGTR